jgi:c-di-GMP-binding flagellar brake protein YcgR
LITLHQKRPFAMHQKDNWLNIASPLEIESILRFILDSKTLLRMEAPDRLISVITTILQIDAHTITVDKTWRDSISQQLIKADTVLLEAALKEMQISFDGAEIMSATHAGRPALRLAMPKLLKRLQRREFARVKVPVKSPALCTLSAPDQPEGNIRLALRDIGPGGLSLMDSQRLLGGASGTQYEDCRLELPDVGWVNVGLRVVHNNDTPLKDGKTGHNVGCVFVDASDTTLMLLRHYAWRLERLHNTR